MTGRGGRTYAEAGPVRRAVRQVVTTRTVAAASARWLPGLDRLVLRLTGGRATAAGWLTGLPVVTLTTVGARSGLARTTQVLGVPDGRTLLVLGANFGADRDPAWVANLRAHPEVVVTRGRHAAPHRASELSGAEREAAFDLALRLNPGWTRFRDRAGDRPIPVLRLVPA